MNIKKKRGGNKKVAGLKVSLPVSSVLIGVNFRECRK